MPSRVGNLGSWVVGAAVACSVAACGGGSAGPPTSQTPTSQTTTSVWARSASPCDGVDISPTRSAVPVATLPPTAPPPGETVPTTDATQATWIRFAAAVDALDDSTDFAGWWPASSATDRVVVAIRTRSGKVPSEIAALSGVVVDQVLPARSSTHEVRCVEARLARSRGGACDAVANRVERISYDAPADVVVIWTKANIPATSVQDVAHLLGLDPLTIRLDTEHHMAPPDEPPFCPAPST